MMVKLLNLKIENCFWLEITKMNIHELMKDEASAPGHYMDFIRNTKLTKTQINAIKSIIRDEKRHWKILNKIKRSMK